MAGAGTRQCVRTQPDICSVVLIMSLHQTLIDDPNCLLESPGKATSPRAYASNSESESSPTIFSPSLSVKGKRPMKRASYSSKRDLLSSFDRELMEQVHQDHGSEADEQSLNCAPRWEAEFRQVNLYIQPTSLYKTS